MDKERKVTNQSNAIIVFQRDVNASELKKLSTDFKGDIVINGNLFFDEEISINCDSLYAYSINSQYHKINIMGDLYVKDYIDVCDIKVIGSVLCKEFYATDIVVSEDFEVTGDVIIEEDSDVMPDTSTENCNIHVGGDFICKGFIENVDSMEVVGEPKIGN